MAQHPHDQQSSQQQHMYFQQQKLLMLQQQQQQQQKAQSSSEISRFPSNMDAHFRAHGLYSNSQQPKQQKNPNNSMLQQLQKKGVQAELQLAYQDAWRVSHPDFKTPFSSLQDAFQRLLPYHVVADYEAEEDDKILYSDTSEQILSRSQQWDQNIAAKVGEFINTFEKQALAFNIITRKRAIGEFRSEERFMVEQALLQDEKRAMLEIRAELELRENAGHESHVRMAAMAQPDQNLLESHSHLEMMGRMPITPNAIGSQGNSVSIGHDMRELEYRANQETVNGLGNNIHRYEKEPSEDFKW